MKRHTDSVSGSHLAQYAFLLRCESRNIESLLSAYVVEKDITMNHMLELERLLLLVDSKMHTERVNLVNLLKYVGGGIENRENHIKELLAKIAILEKEKSKEEDLLSEQTLRTIEVVNIDDINTEMTQLDKSIGLLNKR